ncbi:hypothetical protein K438DRAFT_1765228 [Mycena galopus ATCC 62051]|nr:hypothetical protein K438DRAFT_1765228 [Mycena galopus ATCC 62051]
MPLFPTLPIEQALDLAVPSQPASIDASTLPSNASSPAGFAPEPLDAIYAALYSMVLASPVPGDFDASTFPLEARFALATIGPAGTYMLPKDHLMHSDDPTMVDGVERTWTSRPMPTSPYDMGLSYETSGWRAPAWRSPECREIESACINPALLLVNQPKPGLLPSVPGQEFSTSFDIPDPAPVHSRGDIWEEECDEDMDDNQTADPDFEELPKRTRATRPLPRRIAPKASLPSATPRAVSTSSTSTSTSTSRGTKRKATGAASSRAPKKAAVAGSASLDLPYISGVNDPGLPPPANSAGVCPSYWPLLRLGCTIVANGIKCGIHGCNRTTNSWGDMGRHVPAVHYRADGPEWACDACPRTFSRKDAHKRHVQAKRKTSVHFTAARKAFLQEFNTLPSVIEMRAECDGEPASYMELNDALDTMFERLFLGFGKV